jgi:hypothetical protein
MESAKFYWDERYASGGNSGYGSYGEQLEKKIKWLSGLNIKSISEIGCGDFNFGSRLLGQYPGINYVGMDISSVIIAQNKEKYPQGTFTTNMGEVPSADLLLCIDVLFHVLDDEEYELVLKTLENLQIKYLAVTSYETESETHPHIKTRQFDYKRFGEPIIREIVEERGQLYFYLFEKKVDVSKVSLCLNTKEKIYPQKILDSVANLGFGEILIKTGSDSPYCKYELFEKAKYDLLAYQDDDAICPWKEIIKQSKPDMINLAMTEHHFDVYDKGRMTMGLGWGSIFPRSVLKELKRYTDKYGEDELFKRDTEKILTELVYPQNRLILHIESLPSAMNPDRLSFQPQHYSNKAIIEERCRMLV